MRRSLAPLALAVSLVAIGAEPPANPSAKWEKDVAAIEKRVADAPKGGLAFVGSSSIRLWDVPKSFPDTPATNVGFGGSVVRDSTHFAPRIVLPLEPKAIVFYAGDNDIGGGRSPEQVRDDFAAFATVVHDKLPKTRILFIAVKPSLKRWDKFGVQQEANKLVREACEKDPARLTFVDIVPAMLGADGKPNPELLKADGLHMTEKGYEIWTAAVNKALAAK